MPVSKTFHLPYFEGFGSKKVNILTNPQNSFDLHIKLTTYMREKYKIINLFSLLILNPIL